MRTVLVALVVLLLAAVGADRVAATMAGDRAETRLAAEGMRDPKVEVRGFPFLTQLLDRRFSEVHVTADELDRGSGQATDLTMTATDVSAPNDHRATLGGVTATGTVSYAEVLRRSGARDVRLEPAGQGRVRLRGTASVLGQSLPVAAVGRVHAAGRAIRVVPTGFEVDGAAVDSASLLDALRARFTLEYRLTQLPAGVRLTDVVAQQQGFRVTATGSDVTVTTG